ncbi:MAG: hypothetical protein HQ526_06445 [Actinobacteria bacterium]|nr:hypothetical protein [Actinomycetota bacterium]
MTRADHLWIGVKFLGLWVLLLAVSSLFSVLEPLGQLIFVQGFANPDSSTIDSFEEARISAHYVGFALVDA